MFSPHLFNHVYDIDLILAALCGPAPVILNTHNGTFTAQAPAGVPPTHLFPLEPLPAAFVTELTTHPELRHLSSDEQHILHSWLAAGTVTSLPEHFAQGRPGGWLRERVKEAALDWLDSHDLIPPSMRHINRTKTTRTTTGRAVTIESDTL